MGICDAFHAKFFYRTVHVPKSRAPPCVKKIKVISLVLKVPLMCEIVRERVVLKRSVLVTKQCTDDQLT